MKKGDRVQLKDTPATGTITKVTQKERTFFPGKLDVYTVEWDDGIFSYSLYNVDLDLI